jgi:nitrate/nitrite transport system substrate-binding protein
MKKIVQILKVAFTGLLIATATTAATAQETVKLGFIPLTDCAPLVIAKEKGLFAKYGVNVVLSKEASWANIRDKVLTGELDGAHCLFGMPFSVYTGVGGKAGQEMRIAMVLNNNGQGITLSKELCGKVGYKEYSKVPASIKALQQKQGKVTFAMTFPGGTHDIWLRLWMTQAGLSQKSANIITIPPPQMVQNMRVGNMDAYSVGEPWNGVAAAQSVGFTHVASQDLWSNHPEKALVVNKAFSENKRETLKKIMKALIEACKFIDDPKNITAVATIISDSKYVNAKAQLPVLEARMKGTSDLGCDLGAIKYKGNYMRFYNNGYVNMPRLSHGIWFMTQYARVGYLSAVPADAQAIANKIIMNELYAEVAKEMGVPLQLDDMKPFSIAADPVVFDPNHPSEYLAKCKH